MDKNNFTAENAKAAERIATKTRRHEVSQRYLNADYADLLTTDEHEITPINATTNYADCHGLATNYELKTKNYFRH